ncbi:MAG: cytochrome b/b6 domain-containing protein, partial [Gemmatimonadales bacterium]
RFAAAGFIATFAAMGWTDSAAAQPVAAQVGQAEVMQSVCSDCHSSLEGFRLEALAHADSLTCVTCHHVGFSNDPELVRLRRIDQCRDCHDDIGESHSGIGDRAPECTECHSIHGTREVAPNQVASARCGVCHSEPHPAHVPLDAEAPVCADCHTVHGPGEEHLGAATSGCASCHAGAHPAHDAGDGWFGIVTDTGAPAGDAVTCVRCHGVETGFAVPRQVEDGCAECHGETGTDHAGHRVEDAGCTDCHDLALSLVSRRGRAALDRACGDCHEEPWSAVQSGAHGLDGGTVPTPGCATCHPAGQGLLSQQDLLRRRIGATALCVECHEAQATLVGDGSGSRPGSSYGDDFHGETILFLAQGNAGVPVGEDVLLCSDCHGAHDVHLMDRAEVAPVCDRCHTDVGERLAGAWLGHEPPGPRNALPVWLVRMGYTVLIPFMLGGLFLTIVFHLKAQRRSGARMWNAPGLQRLMARIKGQGEAPVRTVPRFSRTERMEHMGSMVTFILLVVTGLPQTRPDLPIAQGIIDLFGGIWATRVVHRVVGVAFVLLMVTHVARAVVKALRRRRLPIMVPERKDFTDVVQTFRHYLTGTPLPRVGKFDFAQKFEYWGLFLGGIVMSFSGVVLLFPDLFTLVLPGVIIAAIRTMHGLEATFAVLVVVLWHSYGVVLRPEIFPLDTTIFTGKMRVDRLRHEHALEYERLFPEEHPE